MKSIVNILKRPKKLDKQLNQLNKDFSGNNFVQVGLPKDSNNYPDGTSVILVGTVHEFGSPARNIPQRSFLRTTLERNKSDYLAMFKKLAKQIINKKTTLKKAMGLVGLQIQTDVKEKITDIKEPTLKSRQGNPLVDTGHLRQSITYLVVTDKNAN